MRKLIGVTGKIIFHKDMKRISSLTLVFIISFFVVFSNIKIVNASVGDIVVQGGSFGTAGLPDGAASIAPFATLVLLSLKCADIEVNLTNESLGQGITPSQYATGQINQWLNDCGMGWDVVEPVLEQGLSIAEDGYIYISDKVGDLLRKFGNWVTSNVNNNFAEAGQTVADNYYSVIHDLEVPCKNTWLFEYINPVNNKVGYYVIQSNDYKMYCIRGVGPDENKLFLFSSHNDTVIHGTYSFVNGDISYSQSGAVALTNVNNTGWYFNRYVGLSLRDLVIPEGVPQIPSQYAGTANYQCLANFLNGIGTDLSIQAGQAELNDCFVGNPSDWSDYVGGLEIPEGYQGAIDPGIITDLEGNPALEGVISVPDYFDVIREAIDEGVADIPIASPQDGVIVVNPDIPVVPDPAYEQVQDEDVPDTTVPVLDPDIPASDDEIIEASKVTGLTEVFPFCIPFDLYNLLNKFTAEPQAPRFTFDYTVPVVNETIHYDFDFSGFNSVAAVLRTMELVAAIVGLAVATRAIFIRG